MRATELYSFFLCTCDNQSLMFIFHLIWPFVEDGGMIDGQFG
jgi:hypothetical protein